MGNSNFVEMLGKTFGRLTVKRKTEERGSGGNVVWDCVCVCGNPVSVGGAFLRNGNTRSCGCLKKEKFTNRKHGMSHHPLYEIWTAMLQRCYNPKDKKYEHYGGRGIEVCGEWRQAFSSFHEWAIANRYEHRLGKAKLTIDRRDNDRGYSPDNCRWVTYTVQNNNRRPYKASGA